MLYFAIISVWVYCGPRWVNGISGRDFGVWHHVVTGGMLTVVLVSLCVSGYGQQYLALRCVGIVLGLFGAWWLVGLYKAFDRRFPVHPNKINKFWNGRADRFMLRWVFGAALTAQGILLALNSPVAYLQ